MRRLRTYSHMAQKMYFCDNCHNAPIFPGDIYKGEVYAHNKRIIVKRYHEYPCCSDFPDPDEVRRIFEEMDRLQEENLEKKVVKEAA